MYDHSKVKFLELEGCQLSLYDLRSVGELSDAIKTRMPAFGKRRSVEYYIGRELIADLANKQGFSLSWEQIELQNFTKLEGLNGFLSISHTRDLCALAWSANYEVGLDVESLDREVKKSYEDKFVNDEDRFEYDSSLKRWCAKEACFKSLAAERPKALKEVVIKGNKFYYNGRVGSYSFREFGSHLVSLAILENK